MFYKNKLKIKSKEIDLDEIFLDSKNISDFDTERFEGRLEFPLSVLSLKIITSSFFIIFLFLISQSLNIQVIHSEYFKKRAENNSLKSLFIYPPRGEIYDRNGVSLAWNEPLNLCFKTNKNTLSPVEQKENKEAECLNILKNKKEQEIEFERKYTDKSGFSLMLGFLGLEPGFSTSTLFANFKTGRDGIEKIYDKNLLGRPGVKIMEVDSLGEIISYNTRELPESGETLALTVDSRVSSKLSEILSETAENRGFNGGAGIIMDVKSGEILAISSYPEYSSEVLSKGSDKELINDYLKNEKNVFLNRAISGVYAPGSVIKPMMALAALNENIVTPNKVILTRGSISLENPYSPGNFTVFRDWKNHGEVDMLRALAVSSDVYFYTIGGGYAGIKGLGISKIKKYAEMFRFNKKTGIDLIGEKEGVIPGPELKAKLNPEDPDWRIGDTYHASIGQGNFQATPIEMAVYATALANKGKMLTPYLVYGTASTAGKIDIPEEYFDIVQKGMRMAVTDGTAKGLSDLNFEVAGKTGTAEIGKKYVNSWFIGFWPYENPRYSITVVLERGDPHNLVGGVYVARQLLGWMQYNTPEYIK